MAIGLLALSIDAQASLSKHPERGRYVFEASATAGIEQGLKSDPLAPLLANGREVEISWLAREGTGLREYRLTAVIQNGALAGTVAHWTVEPGTGELLAGGRARAYRVRLPLLIEPGLQIHAALEAVHSDGERHLLAQQDATPRGGGRMTPPAGPRLTSDRADDGLSLVPSSTCRLCESAPRAWLAPSPGPSLETGTPSRHRGCQRLRDRSPPLHADPLS